jgi:hypothetical protein
VPSHRLQARLHRGKAWEVRIDTGHFLTREEAARALALVYPGDPAWRGVLKLKMGLTAALRSRLLEQPRAGDEEPDRKLIDAYNDVFAGRPELFRHDDRHRLEVWVFLGLDAAARLLALVYPEGPPRRFGRATAERGLQDGAARRLHEDTTSVVDPELVARYRELLVEVEIFPPAAAEADAAAGDRVDAGG